MTLAVSTLLLGLVIRGDTGHPIHFQKELDTRVGGPLESSNSTSRYALMKSLAEDKSVFFNEQLARFSAPDVVYYDNKFFTIFTPGISFIGLPFYIAGNYLGIPQLFSYLSVSIFLIVNLVLIAVIARKLGAGIYSALLGGLVFAFATNALAYSLTLTQHLTSTAIILSAFLIASGKKTFLNYLFFGVLCGIGALVDIPNLFLLTPVGIYLLFKSLSVEELKNRVNIVLRPAFLGILIGIIPFVVLFGAYNFATTGSYTLLGQSIGQSNFFDSPEKKLEQQLRLQRGGPVKKSLLPFKTRDQLQGLYIFGVSNERSWLYYSPIILVGIAGLYQGFVKRKNKPLLALCVTVGLVNFVMYTMFGDPWGGWSFGPRYLIPSAAILSVGVGVFVQKYAKRIIVMIPFVLLLGYSVYVSFLGALTTNAIPPKQEAQALADPIPYTYSYNLNLMELNNSSSLFYNTLLKGSLDLWIFHIVLVAFALLIMVGLILLVIVGKKNE